MGTRIISYLNGECGHDSFVERIFRLAKDVVKF